MINNCTQTRFNKTYGPDATNRMILSSARNIFLIVCYNNINVPIPLSISYHRYVINVR